MADPGEVIVVGVDASAGSVAALDFALTEAVLRGCAVEVVTGWLDDGALVERAAESVASGSARVHAVQDAVVDRCLDGRAATPPLERVVVHDYAGRVLVSRAERAAMVVVGSREPPGRRRQLLGSVAEYCLRHSPAPVVIVPAPAVLERPADDRPAR